MADVQKTTTGEAISVPTPNEHYEEVAEYRVGEGAPPLALVVVFALIVIWAMTSWVPFFGY
ncbi:MAG: hypothetical protein K2X77_25390 [Candidatus Obscuribacterales bacterium]|nr:hypothetical protein [Candidatus Obscuribacterales bacterium]